MKTEPEFEIEIVGLPPDDQDLPEDIINMIADIFRENILKIKK